MVYLVTYDMHGGYDYSGIEDVIKVISAGRYHHAQGSVWLLKSSQSAASIYTALKTALCSDDELLVVEITNNWKTNSWDKTTGDIIRSWF